MSEELKNQERELIGSLGALEADANHHRLQLASLEEELEAIRQDLAGIRHDLLVEFLDEHLGALFITYTINVATDGSVSLNLAPTPGGELEYDKMVTGINWPDMTNVPLFYLLSYLGLGTPWSTASNSLNA